MENNFVGIGFKSLINASRIIAVVNPDSAPVKRIISDAGEKGTLVDATYGRKTRSVIIMDSGHVVLSLIGSDTIGSRLNFKDVEEQ
mgnify:FL=1